MTMTLVPWMIRLLGASADPVISPPVAATIEGTQVVLRGSGFGSVAPGSKLIFETMGRELHVPSSSSVVKLWREDRIEVEVPEGATTGTARVAVGGGVSEPATVFVFGYDWFDIPPTPGTNALPLSIDVGADGRVWVNQEFHRELQMLDPTTGVVRGLPIPQPPDPGPFANTIFFDHRTQTSVLGEHAEVDESGRVWFTQGGGSLYSGEHANHSRAVSYWPETDKFRVYNMPDDWNELIGLAWDAGRERLWVANGGLSSGAKIASFDPRRIPSDNHFDFSTGLLHQVCRPGEPEDDCYRVYELPNVIAHPAHMLVDDDGFVWFTAYWGRTIGRLNPASGEILEYPLPEAIGKAEPVPFVGPGPWEIRQAPNGDIIFSGLS